MQRYFVKTAETNFIKLKELPPGEIWRSERNVYYPRFNKNCLSPVYRFSSVNQVINHTTRQICFNSPLREENVQMYRRPALNVRLTLLKLPDTGTTTHKTSYFFFSVNQKQKDRTHTTPFHFTCLCLVHKTNKTVTYKCHHNLINDNTTFCHGNCCTRCTNWK